MSETKKYLAIILVFLIYILAFSLSLFSVVYNMGLYDDLFLKHDVYTRFEKEDALAAVDNILLFLDSKTKLDNEFFKSDEISHLNDVKFLFNRIKLIFNISLMLFLGLSFYVIITYNFWKFYNLYLRYILYSAFTLIFFIILLYSFFGFDFIFLKFHEIFFIDNYSFDPNVSNMKALFPDSFFLEMSFLIITRTLILIFLLFIPSLFQKFHRNIN